MSKQTFLSTMENALEKGVFVRLSLAGYKGSDSSLKKILVRPTLIKKQPQLSFTYQYKTRDITKNFPIKDGLMSVADALQGGFTAATLFTTEFDLQFPSMKKAKASHIDAPALTHDRAKRRPIAAGGQAYLHALGITGADGKVLSSGQDKYRQINKFIELMGPLLADIPSPKVADMGSGKGYLTFALYDYLTNTLKRKASVVGIEDRADMVNLCNDIAFTSDFTGLSFVKERIDHYDARGVNVLIALHACDTATDDAIAKGIRAGADVIVVAPCCHKQIRREIEASKHLNDLAFLTRHGTFLERQAEMITDALRAMILEAHGYTVKVFEFIADAHTPKNVMITATRSKTPKTLTKKRAEIESAKAYFGIKTHHLEKVLNKV